MKKLKTYCIFINHVEYPNVSLTIYDRHRNILHETRDYDDIGSWEFYFGISFRKSKLKAGNVFIMKSSRGFIHPEYIKFKRKTIKKRDWLKTKKLLKRYNR